MRNLTIPISLLLILLVSKTELAYGYEVYTHATVSEAAANASSLDTTLSSFGISPSDKFELGSIQKPEVNKGTPIGWIREGSILEDDTFTEAFMRYKNHFFNPLNTAGYSYLGLTGIPAPDWGLEDTASYSNQSYSLKRAREYLYQGLTLADPTDRKRSLAKTFRALGQVGHLLQDMAQPQHTRNDSHGGYFLGPKSLYEAYTEEVRARLPLSGYAPVYSSANTATFANARSFWTQASGVGLAQFSNWNFVSAGTNFDNSGMFNFPLFDPAKRVDMDIQAMCASANPPCPNPALTGTMTFYGTTVEDRITGQKTLNPMASTESLFDADLQKASSKKVFTLNRFNFELTNGFVIPRAVGYSAGLINYFFRGKIDLIADVANPGAFVIQNLSNEEMSGNFTLYYDAQDGQRYPVAGPNPAAQATWESLTIPGQGSIGNLRFSAPASASVPGNYFLVFSGTLGEEKTSVDFPMGAVVAKAVRGIGVMPKVAAGTSHVLMVFNGRVKATGSNGAGQLGRDNSVFIPYFQDTYVVEGIDNVTDVAASAYDSFALKSDGSVWWWGRSANSYVPSPVPGLTDVKQISGDAALKNDGSVWVLDYASLLFRPIDGLSNVKQIASGLGTTAALGNDGAVYVYGDGHSGIFGDGSFGPTAGSGLRKVPISDVAGITTGYRNVLAWKKDGTLWGWGWNYYSQLGVRMQVAFTDGGAIYCYCNPTPTQVPNVTGVTAATLGMYFSLVNENSSQVWKVGGYSSPSFMLAGTNYANEMAASYDRIVLVEANTGSVQVLKTNLGPGSITIWERY